MINPQKQKELDDLYQSIKNEESKTRDDIYVVYVSISKLVREYLIFEEKVGIDIFSEYGNDILDKSKSINTYTKFKLLFPNSNWQIEHCLKGFYRLQGVLNTTVNPTNEIKLFQLKTTKENVSAIIEHLENILKNPNCTVEQIITKDEIQEHSQSTKTLKNEKNYDRITGSFKQLSQIFEKMYIDRSNGIPLCEYPEAKNIDQFKICTEIDQFKIKYPDTYQKYLRQLLIEYATLMFSKNEFISKFQHEYEEELFDPYGFEKLFTAIDYIIEHLKGIFKIEDVRDILNYNENDKTPKPQTTAPPKGKTQLTREQTALLFWYLREKELIAQPTNENIAQSINILTGHSKKQIQDIIKSPGTPVYLLGKGDNKINRNDFKTVISELEKLIEQIRKDYKINSDTGELR